MGVNQIHVYHSFCIDVSFRLRMAEFIADDGTFSSLLFGPFVYWNLFVDAV